MKIGFFITARLKSSRLKQKILLDLNGKCVLDRVIERAQKVSGVDGIVLCTSTNPQDSILYNNALSNGIQFYAGSEDDVLDRLLGAAQYYGYDAFVSITADNPLFSIYTSSLLVDMYQKEQYDFINTIGLPIGCGTYMLDVKALEVVNFMKKQSDTEIWGPFINRPDFFNVANLIVKNSPFEKGKRITLDYPEDYSLFRSIYRELHSVEVPRMVDVFDLYYSNSKLFGVNEMHEQQMPSEQKMKEIDSQFQGMKSEAVIFANSLAKELKPGLFEQNVSI